MRLFHVSSFSQHPFSGNPAAVCLLTHEQDDAWMQGVALNMNLSETAFVLQTGDHWRLRWFTPAAEVDLCGHATLAAARILFQYKYVPQDQMIRFQTKSGELRVSQTSHGLQMDFPAKVAEPVSAPEGLLEALGLEQALVFNNKMDYLVEIEKESMLASLSPDMQQLAAIDVRGVIVTCQADSTNDYDFASRFFAPAVGVPEDPVTGSAHCCLAPYWAEKFGKHQLVGYQASARGGRVHVEVKGDRVLLGGHAVVTLEGNLVGYR